MTTPPSNDLPPIMIPDERLCATCYGLGYIIPEYPPGTSHYAVIPCTARCNQAENRLKLRKLSQVPSTQADWWLRGGRFPKSLVPKIKELLAIVYADDPAGFWYFHGPNGVGKSYILIAAVNEALRQQRSAIYTTTSQLLDHLRKATAEGGNQESQLINRIQRTTVVCIDELGRERSTEYAMEKLFNIFNGRYEDAHNYDTNNPAKLTIIAGNYPVSELESYLQSRLRDFNSTVVNMQQLEDRRKNRQTSQGD